MRQTSLLYRAFIIAVVACAILLPLQLVNGKIGERKARAVQVVDAFAMETSGPQTIVGPLLALTCEETYTSERQVMKDGKAETITDRKVRPCPTAYFPPKVLGVSGTLPVELRYRGIYPIRMYRAALEMAGTFDWPGEAPWNGLDQRAWKNAYLVVATTDARGIKSVTPVSWGATKLEFASRKADADARFALQAALGQYAIAKPGESIPFRFAMEVVGTASLAIAPTGDTTTLQLSSNWAHPSFTGPYLPDERTITPAGFEAKWRATQLATGGRGFWNKQASSGEIFATPAVSAVTLFDPLDIYSLSHRATEYGFLFVLFTFAALALAEVVAGIRLHPMQYLLVGCALAVFFLLLVALAEQVRFAFAYAISASACVVLLTFYLRHPLGTAARTAVFFVLFVALYGSLYVLLRMEDHALLVGSFAVFALLAMVMVLTRKVDWAQLSLRGLRTDDAPA
jgi:inner membrane protein